MTDYKKLIGSLCIFGFEGTTVPSEIRHFISEWNLGGVILFKRNIESKEQLKELIAELKNVGARCNVPLLISVDHEGGRVFRLPPPFTQIPTARDVGAYCNTPLQENYALQIGQLMGRELREVGFNLNFAPVLDVDTNPNNPIIGDRAYSSDPQIVSQVALQIAEGLRSEGLIPCGKHFPGHGETTKDSHLDLPEVDLPLSRLEKVELLPFREAIANQMEMLMTAHVLYPQIDPEFPATLSKKIITGILREKLGYKGVVISDDFLMKAISDRYGVSQAARLFLEAGGDIVLICKEAGVQTETLESLEKWVGDKKILEQSLTRINALKKRLSLFPSP